MVKSQAPIKKRFSRKGRVPIHIRITPELKAKLKKRAKEEGMSLTGFTSFLMEQGVLQKLINEVVDKEQERYFAPLISLMLEADAKTRQTNRILRRILDNPSEDINTIVKQVEEEAIN